MPKRAAILAFALFNASIAHAGNVMVDVDALERERVQWEGVAVTNQLLTKQIADLKIEAGRLESAQRRNFELQTQADNLHEFASVIVSNSFFEWQLAGSNQTVIAKLEGDDGEAATLRLQNGNAGRVLHTKLDEADVRMLGLLKSLNLVVAPPVEAGP